MLLHACQAFRFGSSNALNFAQTDKKDSQLSQSLYGFRLGLVVTRTLD